MDRSFSSPGFGKSPFSPRVRQNISSNKNYQKYSRYSVSGKSIQSVQIILTTPHNYVERFGQPLPVLVTEALTFVDRNAVISARISEHGYAWIVCGRRLLIWQYRQSPAAFASQHHHQHTPNTNKQRKSSLSSTLLNQCFELQLPQSDLAHRAELVAVFLNGTAKSVPACVAVSPEGVVRYWPAIVHEGVSIEQIVDLQGQECDSLTEMMTGLGCILATTTCTVVLVQPKLNGGQHALSCKALRAPTGWLGGLSKRMSSLIFGNAGEHSAETRLVRVLSVSNNDNNCTWTIYVLAGHSLQKWLLSKDGQEELVFVTELNSLVRDNFHNALWDHCVDDQSQIDTWLLDIQTDNKGDIVILAAAVNVPVSPQLHYALICLPTTQSQQQLPQIVTSIKDFLLLKMSGLYREDNLSNDLLSYRLLLCNSQAYLYNQRTITVIKPQEEPDVLEFNTPQDCLLSGSVCVNTPIFFSRNHGLVSVSSNNNDININISTNDLNISNNLLLTEMSMIDNNNTSAINNLTIYNLDPNEIYNTLDDTMGQLKSAFIFYIKKQENEYRNILNDLFPNENYKIPGIDTILDKMVIIMCKDLLDDKPAGDPRWNHQPVDNTTNQVGLGSSYSMQIQHQLEDKQKAFSLLIKFLRESDLWSKLGACTTEYSTTKSLLPIATTYIIGELSEKLVAAIVLKSLPISVVWEKAIRIAARDAEMAMKNGLTHQDFYFRDVSRIERGLQEVVNVCASECHSNLNAPQVVDIINGSNEIILTVLKQIVIYRQQNRDLFQPSSVQLAPDFMPWTIAGGTDGLLDSLLQMHILTYEYGIITSTNNEHSRQLLLDQLVAISDIIIDGRKCHLESIKGTEKEDIVFKQYSIERQKLIKPFLQEKEWERAAQLAEKYLDFETLMQICEATGSHHRLDDYIDRFTNNGFSEYAYNWFLKENKQGKLLDRFRQGGGTSNLDKLTGFLSDHPSLLWMPQIFEKRFADAAGTLQKLASIETESITRQKTMYILSKLAKLAADNTTNNNNKLFVNNINTRLELITFQEEIPDYVLQQFGYDTNNLRVIQPKDLINLYVCKEFNNAGELEFKKALDLLAYIENDDEEELKMEMSLKIWCMAILRDNWNHNNLDSPIDLLENKLFFKLVNLALTLGADPRNLLPPLDVLIDSELLQDLQDNKNFQFLMKTGYEHVYRTQTLDVMQ